MNTSTDEKRAKGTFERGTTRTASHRSRSSMLAPLENPRGHRRSLAPGRVLHAHKIGDLGERSLGRCFVRYPASRRP